MCHSKSDHGKECFKHSHEHLHRAECKGYHRKKGSRSTDQNRCPHGFQCLLDPFITRLARGALVVAKENVNEKVHKETDGNHNADVGDPIDVQPKATQGA